MSVLVYTETEEGKFKKAALEAASYARGVADMLDTSVTAVAINPQDVAELAGYGVEKVLKVQNQQLEKFNARAFSQVLKQAVEQENASIVVLSQSANSKYLAPLLAVDLDAGYASNVVALPESVDPVRVKRSAFSNKAFNFTELSTDKKILGVFKNAFGLKENQVEIQEENFEPGISGDLGAIEVVSVEKTTDKVTIADAEIVVSGGRGLKGPENWGMLEELAEVLGAATACSKPVSDMGWRPHSEHVGQTGKPVAANLYIAVGISGAIQHLAGVNASKTKVVINSDADAPFFKAADYGVVGDAFEVIPRLTEKLKEFKANNG